MQKIIKNISSYLAENNFKKSGSNKFVNDTNSKIIKVIEFQKYSFDASFTINVRIAIPHVYKLALEREFDVKRPDGVINLNIGEIIHGFKGRIINKSYDISENEDLLIELYELLKNKVLPFVNSFNSYNDILNFVDNNRIVGFTIAMKMQVEKLKELSL